MENDDQFKKFEDLVKRFFGNYWNWNDSWSSGLGRTDLSDFFDSLKGKYEESDTPDPTNIRTRTWTTNDGKFRLSVSTSDSGLKYKKGEDMVEKKIEFLTHQLEKAVEKEDYEKAIKFRDELKTWEENKDKLKTLLQEKELAVIDRNYEKAMEINQQIETLTDDSKD